MVLSLLGSNVPSPPDALRSIPTNPQLRLKWSSKRPQHWQATLVRVAVQGGISSVIGPPLMPRGAKYPNPNLDAGGRSELV
ncbi:unnamed protein product [Aspergillus oryzae]|uniref:Unnamed protein product n=1 Tax=Aspergillus oryzae TaxID=5062 RepID=A0AAN4YXZ5_ASPOZ|nr:unnamed protein product [Aspergillus oryzae]